MSVPGFTSFTLVFTLLGISTPISASAAAGWGMVASGHNILFINVKTGAWRLTSPTPIGQHGFNPAGIPGARPLWWVGSMGGGRYAGISDSGHGYDVVEIGQAGVLKVVAALPVDFREFPRVMNVLIFLDGSAALIIRPKGKKDVDPFSDCPALVWQGGIWAWHQGLDVFKAGGTLINGRLIFVRFAYSGVVLHYQEWRVSSFAKLEKVAPEDYGINLWERILARDCMSAGSAVQSCDSRLIGLDVCRRNGEHELIVFDRSGRRFSRAMSVRDFGFFYGTGIKTVILDLHSYVHIDGDGIARSYRLMPFRPHHPVESGFDSTGWWGRGPNARG